MIQYNGSNTFIAVADNDDLDFAAADNFTIEAWVKTNSTNRQYSHIIEKGSSGSNFINYQLMLNYGKFYFLYETAPGSNSKILLNEVLQTGMWYHVVCSRDNNYPKIYVNGTLAGTGDYLEADLRNFYTLTIGAQKVNSTFQNYWDGLIDEVRIWEGIALNESTIKDWMHKSITSDHPYYSHLSAYYKFDEGSGIVVNDSKSTNNGTINGGTWNTSSIPIGINGTCLNTTTPTLIGPIGGTENITITSSPGNTDNLGLYQFGSVDGVPVSAGETFPGSITKRSNLVWGVFERGSVTANIIFDYSNITGISDPSTVKIMKRTDALDATWELTTEDSRDNTARTISFNNISDFSEFAIGVGEDNPLPVELSSFSADVIDRKVKLEWLTSTEVDNYGFEIERKSGNKDWNKI
ncbi:MAG: LamG domain-containing protein, partial [bacterium]